MSTAKRKVLLMGKSGSGKTSMRSVIFSNFSARDTQRLGATIDVEQSAVRFLGSLVLNLWDCGGQASFLDNYLTAQKDTIFSNVAVLIYVFDITSKEWEKDLAYFADVLESLRRNSDDAGVWVLINKMDLRDKEDPKRELYEERKRDIEEVNRKLGEGSGEDQKDQAGFLRCFPTSIWDESLYKAWSSVIHTLIPNINLITSHLTYLRDLCQSTEAVLFESETFLVIAKSGSPIDSDPSEYDKEEVARGGKNIDPRRFEKLSEIIKGFRKTCQRSGEQFMGWECKFDDCTVILEPSTKNTFIMMISPDPRMETAMMQYTIHEAQPHLAEIGTHQTIERKCSLCKVSKDVKYTAKGEEDPNVIAWDAARPEPIDVL